MNKIRLFGMGNNNERSFFVLEKCLDFFPNFFSFLDKQQINKPGSFYEHSENRLLLEEYEDKVEHCSNEVFDIEVFYGAQKIILIIRTKKPREKWVGDIQVFCEFDSEK